jgi:hypothetical protein
MRYPWRHLLTLLLVGTAGIVACLPGPARAVGEAGDEPEPPRRLPARYRDEPAERRRLKEEWEKFRKLPREQRERLRQVDEELNDEAPAARARLWAVLFRYTAWLERLDEKDRQQIESAPDAEKKLQVIKGLREAEWLAHLPRADREQIDAAAPADRPALIASLRKREHDKRNQWQLAFRMQGDAAPPRMPADVWPRVRLYVDKSLIPSLTQAEREELRKASLSGGPEHAQKLMALAEKHPVLVPPSEHVGVIWLNQLPETFRQALFGRPGKSRGFEGRVFKELRDLQGRWPDFALSVERQATNRKVALPEKPLGPCTQEEFVPAVRKFIDELRKDPAAAKKLDEAQGKWPDYPFAVMELAREKNRKVPGTFLPGSKEVWDKAKEPQAE